MSEESPTPQPIVVDGEPSFKSELIHFLLLVGVFAVVIAVIAWSRPLIFDQVLPAVLGTGPAEVAEPPPASDSGTGGAYLPLVQDGKTVHLVQPGEDLLQIARRYGVSAGVIMAANGLVDSAVEPGTELIIPTQ